ncbi:MAG TPA: hypothetical protein VI387_09645 [Candidatus Brocadiales bacterium]|nr:hypothetical protein [Candidatus Brocadiales bacterium]
MKFKVMEWIRKVRDENYEKCKALSPEEKIEQTKKAANEFKKKYSKADSTVD